MDPDALAELVADAGAPAQDDPAPTEEGARVHHGGVADPHVLDFSANTNPRRPPGVAHVYEAALAASGAYPDDAYPAFRAAAAAVVDCEPSQVLPTAGGLDALRLAMGATVGPGDEVIVPRPGFGEYAREVRLQGGRPTFAPAEDLLAVDPTDATMVVCCTPHNPTGRAYDVDRLRDFAARCAASDTHLLVDEAFLGFTDRPSLAGTEGTVVLRSLTKLYGLPGLRAGYAVGTGALRDRLAVARRTWGLGTPAAAVGTYCLGQTAFVEATRERVRAERERLRDRLSARFEVADSAAPFLLLACADPAAVGDLLAHLEARDIAVRDARTFRGLDRHVRVAVRRSHENDRLLEALDV
jgi:threonine-phosphate decarboxylase